MASRSEPFAHPDEPGAVECSPVYAVSSTVCMWACSIVLGVLMYVGYRLTATL
jgi:hypothetical protein